VTITFASPPSVDLLRGIAGVGDVITDGATVRCTVRGEFAPPVDALAGTGLVSLTNHEPSLEDTFLDLYRVPSSK
jgi:hypothetical protein